jgi:hypothetical protein
MNEDIQSEMEVSQPLEKQVNEQVVGESDKAVDKTLKKKRVNFKRLFIASSVIVLVWAVMVIVYLLYYKQDDGLTVPNDDNNAPLPTATVLPTIAFEFYSDDYLEFENPADTTVELVGGINYHPELEGKTINGVQYLSITKSEDIKLEFIYLLQGGEFPYVLIDTETLTLTQDTFNEVTYEYGLKETKLTQAPKIEKVPDYPLYLVQVDEMDNLYLMSMDEDGNYLSVNYGAWVDLDFMGKFTEDTEWGNFVGLKCVTETTDDSEYCKQMVYRFFESVEKKFEENEKYEKPKLEAILELRNQTTAELLNKYRFYIEDYPQGSYVNSSWNSFSVVGQNASLQLIMFEPTYDYADISFSDQRATAPTPDIETTEVFSNLIRGEERVVNGNQIKKSFSYRMYYPDPEKDVCYKSLPTDMQVENYVGCTSYKLKVKGVDAQIQASCTFDPDISNASDTCDELIKSLKLRKI